MCVTDVSLVLLCEWSGVAENRVIGSVEREAVELRAGVTKIGLSGE